MQWPTLDVAATHVLGSGGLTAWSCSLQCASVVCLMAASSCGSAAFGVGALKSLILCRVAAIESSLACIRWLLGFGQALNRPVSPTALGAMGGPSSL